MKSTNGAACARTQLASDKNAVRLLLRYQQTSVTSVNVTSVTSPALDAMVKTSELVDVEKWLHRTWMPPSNKPFIYYHLIIFFVVVLLLLRLLLLLAAVVLYLGIDMIGIVVLLNVAAVMTSDLWMLRQILTAVANKTLLVLERNCVPREREREREKIYSSKWEREKRMAITIIHHFLLVRSERFQSSETIFLTPLCNAVTFSAGRLGAVPVPRFCNHLI